MANKPDEAVLARMTTTLNLEFETPLHFLNGEYESNNDYGLLTHIKDQAASTLCSQQWPPSTQLTALQPRASSHPMLQDVPEAYHS